ncbi:MAG: guanylate kinase [Candidatus Zipacnadales bacterium]
MLVVSGPSGVGKGTIIHHLLPTCPELQPSISYTTRAPREGEVDGRDYFFISSEEFERRRIAGDFLEWAVVHKDQYYGTSRSQVRAALAEGRSVVLEIDCQGAEQVRKQWPDAVLVFIAPPTWAELVRRLRGRHSEGEDEIAKRVESAFREIEKICMYDYIIVNENSQDSAHILASILRAEQHRTSRMACEQLKNQLLAEGRASMVKGVP